MWSNYNTGLKVDIAVGKNKDNGFGNCAIMLAFDPGWQAFSCKTTGIPDIGCGCEKQGEMYLQLLGLCPDSNIDRFYVPRNKKKSGALILVGNKIDNYFIFYK